MQQTVERTRSRGEVTRYVGFWLISTLLLHVRLRGVVNYMVGLLSSAVNSTRTYVWASVRRQMYAKMGPQTADDMVSTVHITCSGLVKLRMSEGITCCWCSRVLRVVLHIVDGSDTTIESHCPSSATFFRGNLVSRLFLLNCL